MISFDEGTRLFGERVGDGELEGSVTVDQVYALYQHEGVGFVHPRGGEAHYLSGPLTENADIYLEGFSTVFEQDGLAADDVMAAAMEDLAGQIPDRAPVEFNVLRQSASPSVHSDGVEVFHRPPLMPRLAQEELNAIRRAEEPIVNPVEWLRQWRYHRGEGGR